MTPPLEEFLDDALGNHEPVRVTPMAGGGSCEVFEVERGSARWVLRRAPQHASSATAHDVLREFRVLDAIKDQGVRIARPVLCCARSDVFEAPFYVMEYVDGSPVRSSVPPGWAGVPEAHGRALDELVDALVEVHAVDWRACGIEGRDADEGYFPRQVARWTAQLESYGGRDLPEAADVAAWLAARYPPVQPSALCHGDYKLDNVLFAPGAPPRLLAVVDWEMSAVGDPLVDLAWALIFHPGDGTMPLGRAKEPQFAVEHLPSQAQLTERYAARSGRDVSHIGWYGVFARWKLAIVLEGSYAKFVRGQSDKPVHQFFGAQADRLLESATAIIGAGRG